MFFKAGGAVEMSDKILVIEDEQKLRRLYKSELERDGYEVVVTADGTGALETLREEVVDLVILDLELPDGSGLEYLKEFMDLKRDLKVVINTDYAAARWDFNSWAADAFLIKSSDTAELKQTVANLLHSDIQKNSKKMEYTEV